MSDSIEEVVDQYISEKMYECETKEGSFRMKCVIEREQEELMNMKSNLIEFAKFWLENGGKK